MKLANYFLSFFFILLALSNCKDNKLLSTVAANELTTDKDTATIDTIAIADSIDNKKKTVTRDTTKYYIYFTLDDGPFLPATQMCKEVLDETKTKATFFMVGRHSFDSKRDELVRSIDNDSLFLLANHSNTHAFRNKYTYFYKHPDSAVNDFLLAEKKLNIRYKIIRLPGMNTWAFNNKIKTRASSISTNVARKLDSLGYSVFGWDLEWGFASGGTAPKESVNQMIRNVDNKFKNKATMRPKALVILAHDRMFEKKQYADSLRKFISILKKNDKYVFDTLDNYPIEEENDSTKESLLTKM